MALIDELEKEGFDTTGITPELIEELKQEGFDTSELEQTVVKSPTFLDKLKTVQEQVVDPALKATPFGQALQVREDVNTLADVAGEKTAETLAEGGIDPRLAAGAGTFMSVADEALELGMGGLGSQGAIRKGAKAVTRPLRQAFPAEKTLKRGIQQAESRAGIKQRAVTLDDVVEDLGIKTRERTVSASGKPSLAKVPKAELKKRVLNRVLDIQEAGGEIPPESAKMIKTLFGDELKKGKGPGGFLRQALGPQQESTLPDALMRKAVSFTTKELNRGVPQREAIAKALGKVLKTKRAVKGAAKIGGGVALAAILRKMFGISQGFGG